MGDLPDSPQENLILPGFVSRREEGVFIDLPSLQKTGGFELFIDRAFTGGEFFSGLDYAVFTRLLYDADWLAQPHEQPAELRLAEKIVPFLPQRREFYREAKVSGDGKSAEYVFEPISIEETCEEIVDGEADENGIPQPVETVSNTRQVQVKLDFDEFVAAMWLKGIKFGIDEKAVRQAIESDASGRVTIAQCLEPTAGQDARILEIYAGLRCDNSPKILANGKADLSSRKNRFPQISKGTLLLKKAPRELGRQGVKVTGEVVEPEIPKDLDLSALASEGVCVEQRQDGEYIVSAMDGFLIYDQKARTVSVSERIENKTGISIQTTGNLELDDVEEYIEHGEVQEGCIVKGKHLTFLSDVFGNIFSQGGNIFIAKNLSGGSAESVGGNISLGLKVLASVVRAIDGEVTADDCENSVIVGKILHIGHAVNCELVADEIYAETLEGCLVAAKKIKIDSASDYRSQESLVTVLLPDITAFNRSIAQHRAQIAEIRKAIEARTQKAGVLKSDAEFAKYLDLYEKIRSGAIRLTAEQAGSWRKVMEKNAIMVNKVAKLDTEVNELNAELARLEGEIADIERDRDAMEEGISCVIGVVNGQTTMQTMRSTYSAGKLGSLSGKGIRDILQKMDSHKARYFSGNMGSVSWDPKSDQDPDIV